MAEQQDVDQFLWEVERALSHVDGEERRALLREAERRLHEAAARIASEEGAEALDWYHYVQASAALGPPEALAAELTGKPLPDTQATHRRLWALAGVIALVTLAVVGWALLSHGTLEPIGRWSGQEQALTDQRTYELNVSAEAESVFLQLTLAPTTSQGAARVTVLDGQQDLVFDGSASLQDHLELARYLEGAPGTWRVIVDFQDYTGGWEIRARQELP